MIASLFLALALLGQPGDSRAFDSPGLTPYTLDLQVDGRTLQPVAVTITTKNGSFLYTLKFWGSWNPTPGPSPGPGPNPTPPAPVPPAPAPTPTPVVQGKIGVIMFFDPVAVDESSLAMANIWANPDATNAALAPLGVSWRAYPKGDPQIASLNLTGFMSGGLPAIVIYDEAKSCFDLDGKKLPTATAVKGPASLDALVASLKKLKGTN